ncbi:unnamed protein product [Lactuca saligna]|uniref:Uncharacterized protein n=1 Tax=Lactuca saligna TaxID=75948 RepID=A0AA35ZVE5_LACSI|nr:unnamed protein product [Lactuca saligna]
MYNGEELDYYELLDEILEIDYYGMGRSTIVLFKFGPPSGGKTSSLPEHIGLPRIPLIGGSISGAMSSFLPNPNGLLCIPLTSGYVPGATSSPLSKPSGLPHRALICAFVLGARSSPFPGPSYLLHNIFIGGSISGGKSSADLSVLQDNPCLCGSTPRVRSSPDPTGLPRIPLGMILHMVMG